MTRQKGEIGLTVAFFLIVASLISTVAVNTIKNFDTRKKAAEPQFQYVLNIAQPSPATAYTCAQMCPVGTTCVSIGTDALGTNGKLWISENVSTEKRYPDIQCREIVGSCTTPISWLSNGITCSSDGTFARAQWT
ncbi:hypothetical protein MUP32_06845, partial [Candidatus Microgenomates bacterium]|nr:hypothetical protein [Candidatus Microgenomates bacterium]